MHLAAEKINLLRAVGGLCCLYGHGAPQLPLQGGNTPSVPSAVPSINHDTVHQSPIGPPDFVRDIPAANDGVKVYSFGGPLSADVQIEYGKMPATSIRAHIADTRNEGDQEVGTTRLKFGFNRLYSFDFLPCVPIFAYYPPVAGGSAENEVPMGLLHAQSYATDKFDELLASAEHGHPTDIFVVTRSFPPARREFDEVRKQSAFALYVHANLPEGTRLHVIEVPAGTVAVRVAAGNIEIWKTPM